MTPDISTLERMTLAAAAKMIDPTGRHVTQRTLYNAWRAGRLTCEKIGKSLLVSPKEVRLYQKRSRCRAQTVVSSSASTHTAGTTSPNGSSSGSSRGVSVSAAVASMTWERLDQRDRDEFIEQSNAVVSALGLP